MIAIQLTNGPAVYLLADAAAYTLDETGLVLPDGTAVYDVTSANAEAIAGVADPPLFVGAAMTWTSGAWTITDQSAFDDQQAQALPGLKQAKLGELQAIKAQALVAMPYTVDGVTYTVTIGVEDRVDLQEQLTILQGEPTGSTLSWEIVNNVYLSWAVADLEALQAAGAQYILGIYANAASLTAKINAAADAATLAAIDVTQGWPA